MLNVQFSDSIPQSILRQTMINSMIEKDGSLLECNFLSYMIRSIVDKGLAGSEMVALCTLITLAMLDFQPSLVFSAIFLMAVGECGVQEFAS
ncbi:hypothetical protein CCACVL1_23835 [Corchorus capsularis]|uniref:Uncharacterized protein n=1 Tax=Corchorus capsularis TaxID=210143 RepID=A0A1R3GRV7_COCAP|nr:hypothetical protein CCACVL1_23835 [Corchorus capsularis]